MGHRWVHVCSRTASSQTLLQTESWSPGVQGAGPRNRVCAETTHNGCKHGGDHCQPMRQPMRKSDGILTGVRVLWGLIVPLAQWIKKILRACPPRRPSAASASNSCRPSRARVPRVPPARPRSPFLHAKVRAGADSVVRPPLPGPPARVLRIVTAVPAVGGRQPDRVRPRGV